MNRELEEREDERERERPKSLLIVWMMGAAKNVNYLIYDKTVTVNKKNEMPLYCVAWPRL